MSLCLTNAELVELTDYRRRDRQIAALVAMRIRFRVTPTGAIKVLRSDVEQQEQAERQDAESLETCGPVSLLDQNCVYFMQFEYKGQRGLIKIGFSGNLPIRRYQVAQERSIPPNHLIVLGTIPGSLRDEAAIHARFDHLRVFSEWFEPAPELIEFISEAHVNVA